MARNDAVGYQQLQDGFQSSSWLAALPSVSVSFLSSEEQLGSDETELSLNLPIKSGRQRKADRQLERLSSDYQAASVQSRRLFVSGLIRESAWSYRLAQVHLEAAVRRQQLLSKLEQQYLALVEAEAVSEYSLLIVQKELVDTEVERSDRQRELARWLVQYRLVTGMGNVPKDIEESFNPDTQFLPASHPQICLLELGWQLKQQRLLASSPRALPWTVSIKAKNVDGVGLDENQYGLSVEVPMSFLDIATETQNSEWLQGSRDYGRARDQMQLEFRRRWELISSETTVLKHKQDLLIESGKLSARIVRRASDLATANELAQEIILRHQIDAIDAQMAVEINRTLLQQNYAMRLQAVGQPL